MEFRCFTILVNYQPHRIFQPAMPEVVMKLTAEGLTLIELMLSSEGLGPRSSQSRPIYKIAAPTHLAHWPRFALFKFLSNPLNLMFLHSGWIGRRLISYLVSTKVLAWLCIYLNYNLVISPPQIVLFANISRVLSDESFLMKDFRSVIPTLSRLWMNHCSRFEDLECYTSSKILKKNDIMISSPRSGDYHSFINALYMFPLNFELKPVPKKTYIFHDIQPLVPMSSLRFMLANQEAKDIFSTSQDLSIVTISYLPQLFAEVSMKQH
ncbi:predicted protein [Arabidopsis lyrata subsp. lyrata]|uniref:Predicted protein n=1 Tax=Arabidopsis lyrata subsp. lyrata TaxID=81972 RepID=D7MV83_ARALL|nr:predicted protein [Arabidopsis lyrata subsp. lyrata]